MSEEKWIDVGRTIEGGGGDERKERRRGGEGGYEVKSQREEGTTFGYKN